jgi:hypothetical protein
MFLQEYKRTLGSHLIARREFVHHVHRVRSTKGYLVLPSTMESFSCRQLIDQDLTREALLRESPISSETITTSSAPVTIKSQLENATIAGSADDSVVPQELPCKSPESETRKTKRRI